MQQINSLLKSNKNIKLFMGFDNYDENEEYITHYIDLKNYIQEKDNPCKYYKATFYPKPASYIDVFAKDEGCKINFINCGQGDACLIENMGKYVLVDFGGKVDSVKKFLDKKIKSKKIDYAICTHFHADHMADFSNITSDYKIKNLAVVKNINSDMGITTKNEISKFAKNCNASNLTMLEIGECIEHHSHNFIVGEMEFEFLGPTNDFYNLNDNSIVLKLNYKDNSILFTGDISFDAENSLMEWCKNRKIDLKSKVLKVAHHGSKYSTSKEFLETTKPENSVISCGETNKYNHPDFETIERLNEYCFDTSYTYNSSSVDFYISPDGEFSQKQEKDNSLADLLSSPINLQDKINETRLPVC